MGRRQCEEEGCAKLAQDGTGYCKAHGGGKRCQHEGCSTSALGDTGYCVEHGGGRRCQEHGCTKAAQGGTGYCIARRGQALQAGELHQGGSRRRHASLVMNLQSSIHASLQGAWRR
jgi:hypothetical protein